MNEMDPRTKQREALRQEAFDMRTGDLVASYVELRLAIHDLKDELNTERLHRLVTELESTTARR